jgi:putative ABC transport system substrate-binding protein
MAAAKHAACLLRKPPLSMLTLSRLTPAFTPARAARAPRPHPRAWPSQSALLFFAWLMQSGAYAADMTVVLGAPLPGLDDFIAQLRSANAAEHRLTQANIDIMSIDTLTLLASLPTSLSGERNVDSSNIASNSITSSNADSSNVNSSNIRTRSLPDLALEPSAPSDAGPPPAAERGVLVALAKDAARAVMEQPGHEPALLVLLNRLEYAQLRAAVAPRQAERAIGVLLRHPTLIDHLTLIDTLLPGRRNIAIVASAQAEPLLGDLDEAAQQWLARYPERGNAPWRFNIAEASDATSLTSALQQTLPQSDALLLLSDSIDTRSATALTLLKAAAEAGLPVFTNNDAMVNMGALAALAPNPAQLAQQAQALAQRLQRAAPGTLLIETPRHFELRTNAHVARQLGIALPGDKESGDKEPGDNLPSDNLPGNKKPNDDALNKRLAPLDQ